MPSGASFGIFLTAAIVLEVSPGPGMLYVLARSLRGGRRDGLASSLGTATGGFGHVIAAAFGLSVILATSATAFAIVKYAGAAYLVYLGIRTLIAGKEATEETPGASGAAWAAFRQGITTEIFNPKTALFFLSFLPQFVNREAAAIPQFLLLGTISVVLNSSADVVVSLLAGPIGAKLILLAKSGRVRRGRRRAGRRASGAPGAHRFLRHVRGRARRDH
jgi:threonine/homoserine/homoserine lactone efflux protein